VQLRSGCLFCELDSGKDKKLYIVIRGNTNEQVKVLQGTFAGMSSTSDPIGGRELFIREHELDFAEMKWNKLPVDNNKLDHSINKYFSQAEGNCLKIDNRIDLVGIIKKD
jgi:hypothetical protein